VMNLGQGKIAVWKGNDGIPHAVSASCTHKGCTVTWNSAERTWDCPCHGSISPPMAVSFMDPLSSRFHPESCRQIGFIRMPDEF
jgi:hypothetical protein